MHETVDVALQADEDAEVGDGFDLSCDLVAAVVILREFLPGIGLTLLESEGDAAPLLVDVEHHDLHFLSGMHDLRRIDVLVGPVHLRDVHQPLDAILDLNERAVIGDIRNLAKDASVRRIAACDVLPRIRTELLQSEAHARALAVELQYAHFDLVADLHHLGGVFDALPRHVGDVQESVDAA